MASPPSCILFSFFTLFLLQSIAAQNGGQITVGQSLTAIGNGSLLLSPSGDFAFGFHQLPNKNNLFLLAIWYAKIPDTIIWHANDGNPVPQENICMTDQNPRPELGSGICGFNSICSLGDASDDRRPTCTCPQGYSFRDPNDKYSSCKPDFLDGCEGYAERSLKGEYNLKLVPTTDWPFNDYERLDPYNEEDCKTSCLKECFCAAVIFKEPNTKDHGCWKKRAPLSNGRKDTTVLGTTWIKVGNVNISNDPLNPFVSDPPSKAKNKVKSLTKVLLGGQRKTVTEYKNIDCFSYQELIEATNGFKEELGRGAFGVVYKGMINGGGLSTSVAVKKLDRISGDTDKEFKTEVNVIGQTHHKNLVQLVGFCKEDDQRLLVYEYMSNGSLAAYLFDGLRPSWKDRVKVTQGTARGLLYLHEECSTQILHCDINPQNILLDEHQNPRISDFGLAKILVLNQTHTNTGIRGTKGYVAPEWFRNKPVTAKVDVYSFGVLLLEIICCRESVCMELIAEKEPF
ncbi:hypothetical protein SOVF_008840 [Spinacia oleracea]|nr:hypothetical protein SOVF_008840 [Spinacia oleracea]